MVGANVARNYTVGRAVPFPCRFLNIPEIASRHLHWLPSAQSDKQIFRAKPAGLVDVKPSLPNQATVETDILEAPDNVGGQYIKRPRRNRNAVRHWMPDRNRRIIPGFDIAPNFFRQDEFAVEHARHQGDNRSDEKRTTVILHLGTGSRKSTLGEDDRRWRSNYIYTHAVHHLRRSAPAAVNSLGAPEKACMVASSERLKPAAVRKTRKARKALTTAVVTVGPL